MRAALKLLDSFFALEGRPSRDDDVQCTSCEWNQPSKRNTLNPCRTWILKWKNYMWVVWEKVKEKKTFTYKVGSITFRNSLCAKLGNKSRAAIYYVIPPQWSQFFFYFEDVGTSDHIQHISDKFINLGKTIKDENMSQSDFLSFMSTCSKKIVHEIEVRTKGQHDNLLWISARAARITASNVYEIKTRKNLQNLRTLCVNCYTAKHWRMTISNHLQLMDDRR